ncbi:TraB/GumN family protein [Pareuzebyella sediminis]|uniref:TraB/GumN family protein n=1 Tax=Pareuzebyella sediminis TaxID=2607998 RepID=UPI0011EFAB04|nr:TraB/GumN family protein [Pareuzebyella sediminis]
MRLLTLIVLSFAPFVVSAQEAKSLLWEISGNGLVETSYLYGTMHVSKKIAFRLDDVFYEALDQCDIVALESDPNHWLENMDLMNNNFHGYNDGFETKGFYSRSFHIENPRKQVLGAYLAFDDRLINNILYRTNEISQNFEEETYLDMFIYQAGKKFDKPIVALEDLEESANLVARASMNAMKPKPDEWLQKKMQQQGPMLLLQNAYRERNIALLDSIDRAMYTKHYIKYMLHIRNANMVARLDSIMQEGKVFAGIGAAHLPGNNGVIDLLRKKGYTLKPLVSKASAKGKQLKKKFEDKIRENQYTPFGPEDNAFSLNLTNKLYPVSERGTTTYISPDLANGSYVMVHRIPTHSFLKNNISYGIEDIDDLLFENIPGKILEKKTVKKDGFVGIDIKNQLKNRDHQRYQIFKTPLELIIFKMGGEGDYVSRVSDTIFNSLRFRKDIGKKIKISSDFKDFEVEMPLLHTFTNKHGSGNRWIEGYDENTDSYYFLKKAVLSDFGCIEADTFELKQIQRRLFQDLKLSPIYEDFSSNRLRSSAAFDSIGNKHLHLLTTLRRGEYYLLGAITANEPEAKRFFASFRLKEAVDPIPPKKVLDTALYFTTLTSVMPPKFVESSNNYFDRGPKTKPYDPFHKKTIYRNKNDEVISVELNKVHDFLMFENIDSAWALRKRLYAHNRFNILREDIRTTPKGYQEMNLTLTDTASSRGILVKNVIKDGLLYELKAIIDTSNQPSRFVSDFYENFSPMDTVIGKKVFKNKIPDFYTALRQKDSSILDGYRYLKFTRMDVDSLKYYISEYDFEPHLKDIQLYLLEQLVKLDVDLTSFHRRLYAKSYNNPMAQAQILQAIANRKDKASTQLLLQFMENDLPLLSNPMEMNLIFKPYRDSLPLAKELFPDLLDYSTISEYRAPIISLLGKLQAEGLVRPKHYKRYKNQILNDAKIQLKRHLGNIPKTTSTQMDIVKSYPHHGSLLEDYVTLLYPFKNEKAVEQFFQQLSLFKNPRIQTTYVGLQIVNNEKVAQEELLELATDVESRVLLFSKLKHLNRLDLFPKQFRSQKHLAEALLSRDNTSATQNEPLYFVAQKPLYYNNKKLTGYYYKKRNPEDYDKNFSMYLLVFENDKGINIEPYYTNEGMRIEDTDTEENVVDYVTEAFMLKDHPRAQVYRPDGYGTYGFHGY